MSEEFIRDGSVSQVGVEHPCLDHGFVKLVDFMGSDQAILDSARVSTGATNNPKRDRGLIRYLYRNAHTSPFEMPVFRFHIKAPIFVARQWIRHRTASVNEVSGRYKFLDPETYMPAVFKYQSTSNHQGGDAYVENAENSRAAELVYDVYEEYRENYSQLIDMGISREQARIAMPVGQYTEWYWQMDLHNLLHFLDLRMDPHAQAEIREYAKAIFGILASMQEFSYTMEIFNQVREVQTLIKQAMNIDKEFEALPDYLRQFIEARS